VLTRCDVGRVWSSARRAPALEAHSLQRRAVEKRLPSTLDRQDSTNENARLAGFLDNARSIATRPARHRRLDFEASDVSSTDNACGCTHTYISSFHNQYSCERRLLGCALWTDPWLSWETMVHAPTVVATGVGSPVPSPCDAEATRHGTAPNLTCPALSALQLPVKHVTKITNGVPLRQSLVGKFKLLSSTGQYQRNRAVSSTVGDVKQATTVLCRVSAVAFVPPPGRHACAWLAEVSRRPQAQAWRHRSAGNSPLQASPLCRKTACNVTSTSEMKHPKPQPYGLSV
jgi:hypothetical protein